MPRSLGFFRINTKNRLKTPLANSKPITKISLAHLGPLFGRYITEVRADLDVCYEHPTRGWPNCKNLALHRFSFREGPWPYTVNERLQTDKTCYVTNFLGYQKGESFPVLVPVEDNSNHAITPSLIAVPGKQESFRNRSRECFAAVQFLKLDGPFPGMKMNLIPVVVLYGELETKQC